MSLLARLRMISVDQKIAGSAISRDNCINRFIEEFESLASTQLLEKCEDETLFLVYRSWMTWCVQDSTPEQRAQLLMSCIRVSPTLLDLQDLPKPAETSKVVSLFGG